MSESTQIGQENAELKAYIALKEKINELKTFGFNGSSECLIIGEGATSTIKEIIQKEN